MALAPSLARRSCVAAWVAWTLLLAGPVHHVRDPSASNSIMRPGEARVCGVAGCEGHVWRCVGGLCHKPRRAVHGTHVQRRTPTRVLSDRSDGVVWRYHE